jgi:hypothetical protein
MTTNRRTFLGTLAIGGILFGRTPAGAQPGRVLGEGTPDVAAGVDSPELARAVRTLRVGAIKRHGSMAVLFLHGDPGPALPILTLDEARTRGELVITERGQATVPELVVDNRLGEHVLLLAGEILAGGKQNRVVTEDILLPPRSGARGLGVYCVEQGRWDGSRGGFRASGALAGAGLRARLMAKSDQNSVWSAVRRYSESARASSPTSSYTAVLESAPVEARRVEVEKQIDSRAPAGAAGVAVFQGGTLRGVDVLAESGLFARVWPKLLRAAIVDTFVAPPAAGPAGDQELHDALTGLLKLLTTTKGARHTNTGVGSIFEARMGRHLAAALIFESRVVHLAVV